MPAPQEVFLFVDFTDVMARHNYTVGAFTAGAGPAGTLSPFAVRSGMNPVEIQGEHVRRLVAPDAPSRLNCVYAFETFADCVEASVRHSWPLETVRRALVRPVAAVRTNMELVTVLNGLRPDEQTEAIWKEYWNGRPGSEAASACLTTAGIDHLSEGPLWEWLLTGRIDFDKTWSPET